MSMFQMVLVVITIMGIVTAVQTFHNYTMSRRGRFWMAMGILAALIITMALNVIPMSKPVQVVMFAVVLFIYMQCGITMMKHTRKQRREQPYFKKYKPLIACYIALTFQKLDVIHYSDHDVERMKELVRKAPKHAQHVAYQLSQEAFTELSDRKLGEVAISYHDMDFDLLTEDFNHRLKKWK